MHQTLKLWNVFSRAMDHRAIRDERAATCLETAAFTATPRVKNQDLRRSVWGPLAVLLLLPLLCHAQLNFPSSLRNELDLTPIDSSAREVVVLIHGWTAKNKNGIPPNYNRYEDTDDAPALNYLLNILKLKLAGSSKKLVTYRWEQDASTGTVEWQWPNPIPAVALV